MKACLICHGPLRANANGTRLPRDWWFCRACQKEPMPQLRRLLEVARTRGYGFEQAWWWALDNIRWPHHTDTRREWKWLLGVEVDGTTQQALAVTRVKETWRAAYLRTAPPRIGELLAHAV